MHDDQGITCSGPVRFCYTSLSGRAEIENRLNSVIYCVVVSIKECTIIIPVYFGHPC